MGSNLCFVLLIVHFGSYLCIFLKDTELLRHGEIERYTTGRKTSLLLSCPPEHVIIDISHPMGTPSRRWDILKQCLWEPSCRVKQSQTDRCSRFLAPAGCLSHDVPRCVRRGSIADMCSDRQTLSQEEGVIRSDPKLFNGQIPRRKLRKCHKRFLFSNNRNTVLEIQVLWLKLGQGHVLRLNWISPLNSRRSKNLMENSNLRIKGRQFRLKWLRKYNDVGHMNSTDGFLLFYKNFIIDDVKDEPSTHVSKAYSAITSGSISWPLSSHGDNKVRLQCDCGFRILAVNIELKGVKQCTGTTPRILVDRNDCFWKRKCVIWASNNLVFPARMSSNCPSYSLAHKISFRDLVCVRAHSIIDICDQTKSNVTIKHGLIRSHQNYPWYYKTDDTSCRLRLPNVQPNFILHLQCKKPNYDSHDRLTVKHVTSNGVESVINNRNGFDKSITSGHVVIEWNVTSESESGSGFLILFRYLKFKPL